MAAACASSTALEQRTLLMGAVALATVGAVAAGEVGKLWRRRVVAEEPETAPEVIQKGARAALDTVEVARRGYREARPGETVLFNLLSAFVISSSTVRLTTLRCAPRGAAAVQRADRPPPHPPLRARHPARVRVGQRGAVRQDPRCARRSRSRSASGSG